LRTIRTLYQTHKTCEVCVFYIRLRPNGIDWIANSCYHPHCQQLIFISNASHIRNTYIITYWKYSVGFAKSNTHIIISYHIQLTHGRRVDTSFCIVDNYAYRKLVFMILLLTRRTVNYNYSQFINYVYYTRIDKYLSNKSRWIVWWIFILRKKVCRDSWVHLL